MSISPAAEPLLPTRRDLWLAVAIYAVALFVFWHSPLTTTGDSKYTLLLTQNLLNKGSFVLDDYGIPRNPPIHYGVAELDGKVYQIEIVDGHLYYFFPPGSSILSTPFVLVQDLIGKPVIRPDGSYNFSREERNQHFIAAALMAALAAVFYLTARRLLPVGWSLVVTVGGALGTQIWSTASRGLWNHTWGVVLIGCALYLVVVRETGRRKVPPVTLATLLAWAYFVRPTNSLFIIGISLYLLCFHRAGFLRYALTGAAWFAGFAVYSWEHFGRVLPSYYAAARLGTSTLGEALAGNLISPSRGLLIFVPVVLFVVYLPLRFWRYRLHARLLGLAAGVSLCQYVAVSGFVPWYGGGCYGPRYTTELVPWMVLAASLGLAAALRWREDHAVPRRSWEWLATLTAGSVLLGLSLFINERGANVLATQSWNQYPVLVDRQPTRVWDWHYPQVLAGFLRPPVPEVFPVAKTGERIFFGDDAGRRFQYEGWRWSEKDRCWSAERRATLIFATDSPRPKWLQLRFEPYLHPPQLLKQRVKVRLNGHPVGEFPGNEQAPHDYLLPLPDGVWHEKNFLRFDLPDAAAPASLEDSRDLRELGIALSWIELDDTPPPAATDAGAPAAVPTGP